MFRGPLDVLKYLVAAVIFVSAGFITTDCAYKLIKERIRADDTQAFEWRIRRYTDGVEMASPRKWDAVSSEHPLLRLLGETAAWFGVAFASGLILWRLLRPTRRVLLCVGISQFLVTAALIAIFAGLQPHQRERVLIFADPSRDPLGTGFAAIRLRERFIPRWPLTAAVAITLVAATLPAFAVTGLRGRQFGRKEAL
jgi:hypothetical protein